MGEYKEKASFALEGFWGFVCSICFFVNTVGRLCFGLVVSFLLYHLFNCENELDFFDYDSRFDYYLVSISDAVFKNKYKYSYFMVLIVLIIAFVLVYIISKIIDIGLNNIYLRIARYENVTLSDLLIDKKYLLKAILLEIVIDIRIILWTLLLIFPGIVKGYAYSKAIYIFLDNPNKDISDCIRESERIMFDSKWDNFVLDLHFIIFMIISGFVASFSFLLEAGVDAYYQSYNKVANVFLYFDLIGEKPKKLQFGKNDIDEFKEKIKDE